MTQTVFGFDLANGQTHLVQPLLDDFASTSSSVSSDDLLLKSRIGQINFSLGYMGRDNGVRAGYTGLVLPGTCVSSYFIYDLRGVNQTGEMPIELSKSPAITVVLVI